MSGQQERLLNECTEHYESWQAVYELMDPSVTPTGRVIELCELASSWGLRVDERDAAWFFGSLDDEGPGRSAALRAT